MNVTKDSGLIAAKTRLTNYQAELAAEKLKKIRGEVVSIEKVRADWAANVSRVREKLLALPSKLVMSLAGQGHSLEETHAVIQDSVYEVLDELASEFDNESMVTTS